MTSQLITVPYKKAQSALCNPTPCKHVIVFSPDADLSRVLILNLEDRFHIIRAHRIEDFERAINENFPDLVLVDLFTFADGIDKQLEIIHRLSISVPIIILRAYMSLSSEINESIDELTKKVFYKPVDVELVSQAIEDLLK